MNTSILEDELAQLNAQIGRVQLNQKALEGELRAVNAELEGFSSDRQRYDALRDVCTALERLGGLNADELFWQGVAENGRAAEHLEQARGRLSRFEGQISGILEKQSSLQNQIDRCLNDLSLLDEEVRDAYARDARRLEEYVIEREISPVPYRVAIMPWSRDAENERRFRKSLRISLLACLFISVLVLLWKVPPPVRPVVAVVPERLVSMLRQERPKAEPRPKEEKKAEKDTEKAQEKPQEDRPKPTTEETQAARKKAESTGVLAFKEAFKDLMEEAPSPRVGAEARLSKQSAAAPGQARASRSIISMPSGGSGGSGGISNAGVSRNIGSGGNGDRIGGVGFARVESSVAGMAEEARPLSSGPGPARTDEEIQIVFDKYKATLYRMYNAELRKNPTLRGKILLRITIEQGGEVSACTVQSSDLASPELVAQIVERVKKFNFGTKEKVSKTTILYPIDFLPGG